MSASRFPLPPREEKILRQLLPVVTVGVSAFLLFLVQPLLSATILPLFGGGSSIWLTSLVFFQVALFVGYAGAHLLASSRTRSQQGLLLGLLALLSLVFLPIQARPVGETLHPSAAILLLLLSSVGLPYLLLSATSPLVQSWLAGGRGGLGVNPYVLYGVSNAGSLAALVVFPLVLQPRLGNALQRGLWSGGYVLFLALLLACAFVGPRPCRREADGAEPRAGRAPGMSFYLGVLYQAMIPSVALLAFTHHITVDIVNVPLLWVLPLCAYLLSFVVCFLFPVANRPGPLRTLLLLAPLSAMAVGLRPEFELAFVPRVVLTLTALFAICLFFHGNLEREKPGPEHLTRFYLYLSAGGGLGGILVAIVAPLLFDSIVEFPLVVLASLFSLVVGVLRSRAVKVGFAVTVAAVGVLAYIGEERGSHHDIRGRARSFFAAYTIREKPQPDRPGEVMRLLNVGTTLHGGQVRDSAGKLVPSVYYYPESGVASAWRALPEARDIAVVGLGIGSLALFATERQRVDFFEIDPAVVAIARERFEVLGESRGEIRHFVGDARTRVRGVRDREYDLVVIDAFSSGAIPTHLLTREATEELLARLKPGGVLLYHISNRFADLKPVLRCNAEALGLHAAVHDHPGGADELQLPTAWAVLTERTDLVADLRRTDPAWSHLGTKKTCWTDDFSDVWSVVDL